MTAAKGREKKTKATVNPEESTNDVVNFPIIGLGASAGGLCLPDTGGQRTRGGSADKPGRGARRAEK